MQSCEPMRDQTIRGVTAMSAYFAAHPDHAILFAFGCFALTVYLFRYVGPGIGGGGDWSSRDHYERNLRDGPDDYC